MERSEWLKTVRTQLETIYDHLSPLFWVKFGLYDNATHLQFIEKLLSRMSPHSLLLDAACGAGRYDGMLLEAGHQVLGIDQSGSMLARAREHYPQGQFPGLRYEKNSLQEMNFQDEFDGAICMDAMENIFPEDWPLVLANFQRSLKPGGVLYFTAEMADESEVCASYERAREMGLPVVMGEMADKIDAAYQKVMASDAEAVIGELAGQAVYHFYPGLAQVRAWLEQAGFTLQEEASGDDYEHFLVKKG